jgi:hypothetical protein
MLIDPPRMTPARPVTIKMAIPRRKVELHSLQAKPHLNGKRGVVAGLETQSGRVPVSVEGEEGIQAVKFANLKWDVNEEAMPAVAVRAGVMIEEEGRCFSEILDMGRFLVNSYFGCIIPDMEWPDGLISLKGSQKGLKQLTILTSQMYSFWTRANGKPVLGLLRDLVDEQYARQLKPNEREVTGRMPRIASSLRLIREAVLSREVAKWGEQDFRITGEFWVCEQRDDGAVLVSTTQKGLVCLALGIADRITKFFPAVSYAKPAMAKITLLPYKRRLVYDGLLSAAAGDAPADLEQRVREAEATGALVRSIPYPPDETDEERQRLQSGGTPGWGTPAPKSAAGPASLSRQHQELVAKLVALPTFPDTSSSPDAPQPGMWVMRRMGYSETENPEHMGMVMSAAGMALGPFSSAALEPTADELLSALGGIAVRARKRPLCVLVDAQDAVAGVRRVLEQAGIQVVFYPPPSNEEVESIQNLRI